MSRLDPRHSALLALAFAMLASDHSLADDADRRALLATFASEFVEITPGEGGFPKTFRMGRDNGAGNERPAHEVTLAEPFAIAKYEVPQNLYQAVMGENPSKWKGPRNSVEMMTWSEANEFCRRITRLLREAGLLEANEVVRLPTEAEWEYCCRAGTTTTYSFGDEARKAGDAEKKASLLDPYAWHTGNAAGNDPPVGALKPNPWGLYDVHGYLWEFVADEWSEDHGGASREGTARVTDAAEKSYVIRGGSWRDRYDDLTSTSRAKVSANTKGDHIGFRCVKSIKKP